MTSKELVSKYRALGPQDMPVFLHFLADHWHALKFADGQRLNDNSDSSLMLRELAEAFKLPVPQALAHSAYLSRSRWESTCLTCGHVHEGDGECRVSMGKGGVCECKAEVTA